MERDQAAATDAERRDPVVIRYAVDSDARRLRTILHELDTRLEGIDNKARRCVRLLVTEVISRWLMREDPRELGDIGIQCNVHPGKVRLDFSCDRDPGVEFWTMLGDIVAADLVHAWGIDRRIECGAWFEIAREPASGPSAPS